MLKILVIGVLILVVLFLAFRAFGRRPRQVAGTDTPRMIPTSGGAVSAEIDGQELEIDPRVLDEVRRLCENDQKIEAVKLLREVTGLGLAEAKNVVESLDRLHPKRD